MSFHELNFPPTTGPDAVPVGYTYFFQGRAWRWNGQGWDAIYAVQAYPIVNIDGGTPSSNYGGISSFDGERLI